MPLAADAFQPLLMGGLTALQGRPHGSSLGDLIGKQEKIGFFLDFDNVGRKIELDFRDADPVIKSYAFDSNRFASSAFQSMQHANDGADIPEKFSWSIIQSYYAAFYAGHSIIRLLGDSCTYLDRTQISRVVALAQAQSKVPTFKISSTVYHCYTDPVSPAIVRATSLRDGVGGAHEAFWHVFGQVLSRAGEHILNGPLSETEAQSVFAKVEAARQTLTARGAPFHSWLSVIRNEVQYRHMHDVWLPCGVRKQDRELVKRLTSQWRKDAMNVDVGVHTNKPLGLFAAACAFIVALCRELFERIAERSALKSRSFTQLGALALISRIAP